MLYGILLDGTRKKNRKTIQCKHPSPGIVCGLAIYNFTIINLPFPLALYKKLLDQSVGLDDLADLDPHLTRYACLF